jgi:hypothetical protein
VDRDEHKRKNRALKKPDSGEFGNLASEEGDECTLALTIKAPIYFELSLRWPCSSGPRLSTCELCAERFAFSSEINRSANSVTLSSFSKTLSIFHAAAHQKISQTKSQS